MSVTMEISQAPFTFKVRVQFKEEVIQLTGQLPLPVLTLTTSSSGDCVPPASKETKVTVSPAENVPFNSWMRERAVYNFFSTLKVLINENYRDCQTSWVSSICFSTFKVLDFLWKSEKILLTLVVYVVFATHGFAPTLGF